MKKLNKYILKKAITKPWLITPIPLKSNYKFIIVIPALKEGENILPTLQSISSQNIELQKQLLVVFVINNSKNANNEIKLDNQKTEILLKKFNSIYEIGIIDAYSNYPLPSKHAGVGLARKIGFDLVLPFTSNNTVLCSLDADTTISPDYLTILDSYFSKQKVDCLVLGIKHQFSKNQGEEKAIREYEEFLYSTADKLKKVNSPYGFVTMGSAMVFSPECYMKAGGISKKKATEDFYFLQEVVKTSSVKSIPEILVHPSSRVSNRVYLGTGFRMGQAQNGEKLTNLKYDDESYNILKKWISLGEKSFQVSIQNILVKTEIIDSRLPLFLTQNNLEKIWDGLNSSSSNKNNFKGQFHRWFDGLKTYRFLKYFSIDHSASVQ
jgi:cellulose synthase/poly-beta-1,6-N-acetylglucosamine synthase-like glycosyltransferase